MSDLKLFTSLANVFLSDDFFSAKTALCFPRFQAIPHESLPGPVHRVSQDQMRAFGSQRDYEAETCGGRCVEVVIGGTVEK